MALIEFANLGMNDADPRVALNHAFTGLKDFNDYLRVWKKHLESEKVLCVGWKECRGAKQHAGRRNRGGDPISSACWIELVAPRGGSEDEDALFNSFLDHDVKKVHEAEDSVQEQVKAGAVPRRPSQDQMIKVLGRDRARNRLQLERMPTSPVLLLWPNTSQLRRQLDAITRLTASPRQGHKPLIQLLQPRDTADWPSFSPAQLDEKDWFILRDPARPGTTSQRDFVRKALKTPDFAILEGPPGSGKTTAICELILQIVRRKRNPGRVLLCASTHVAVDNVLERLKDPRAPYAKLINPLRIGDSDTVAPKVAGYLPEARFETDKKRLKDFLRLQPPAPSREHLASCIDDRTALQRLMLETSNVVCGTTIGILRLSQLLRNGNEPGSHGDALNELFDVLIVDEASKTPFQEFLVPALLAKRWVLVGDPRQLSPFVDEDSLHLNLDACLPSPGVRNACVNVFLARSAPSRGGGAIALPRQPRVVVTDDERERDAHFVQARELGVHCVDIVEADDFELAAAGIILATPEAMQSHAHRIPLDIHTVRCTAALPDATQRRIAAWRQAKELKDEKETSWSGELGYRMVRKYEQRFRVGGEMASAQDDGHASARARHLRDDMKHLIPVFLDEDAERNCVDGLKRVRRVALPSILEVIQSGCPGNGGRVETALTHGLPQAKFLERHVLLEYQQRMHPELAEFPSIKVYGGKALLTDPGMLARRAWEYEPSKPRARWLHVKGKCVELANEQEADVVIREVEKFVRWARANPRQGEGDGAASRPWEVAVLAFYRAQERLLRERLRQATGQCDAYRSFEFGGERNPRCVVKLCTVDRFQGQEADVVVASLANDHSTVFLESLNRMNVAITRARYLLLLVGDRNAMRNKRSQGSLLHELAISSQMKTEIGIKEREDDSRY